MTDQRHGAVTLQVSKRPCEHTDMAPEHELCPVYIHKQNCADFTVVKYCRNMY